MFHVTGLGVDLRKLFLSAAGNPLARAEEDGPGTGSTLIQGENVRFHQVPSSLKNAGSPVAV